MSMDVKTVAQTIADDLFRRLKAGEISKIGIEEVRAEIQKRTSDVHLVDQLEEAATRAVVWKAVR